MTYNNSNKATVSGKADNGAGTPVALRVVRNTTELSNLPKSALWLNRAGDGNGYYDVYGIDEARELYNAIGEVLADYDQMIEEAKPKKLTTAELDDLKTGARVFVEDERGYREFIKTERRDFVKVIGGASNWSEGYVYSSSALHGNVYKKEEGN